MSHYTQLTREERYQISAIKKAGHNQVEIAKVLGRHKSTVSRELARNCGLRGYRPKQANAFAENCCQAKVAHRISSESWARVEQLLREYWSPEQISNWLRLEENINSVLSGSINTSFRTNKQVASSTSTYAARNNEKSVMGPQRVADR